ncbi:type II toxin-antitoxin system mRNA interferase toxin, RelE/StbE family [Peredibacter starrii]|uniref:Type II toxin-antitoxin system mRNA interferase toxin, RelE/StbE family n=1 Tax=Peredibacter starrii TaxID=28202 RepID=A0AAX4HR34_9BACT|nr:type II toxin-antitoxin system mRNA interferase toxin, RelE/StbE family [Peredibacter starrii]WPU65809.1 type II toxin-antitoxin system mRNA interferase toxin, RelE/StbE family [Peredibacter starrii]
MIRVDLSLVQKDLRKLPPYIIVKLQRWVEGVESEGIEEMRKIPGYHDEPLKGSRAGTRSIRLNKAYRAIYSEAESGIMKIIKVEEVNKHDY